MNYGEVTIIQSYSPPAPRTERMKTTSLKRIKIGRIQKTVSYAVSLQIFIRANNMHMKIISDRMES